MERLTVPQLAEWMAYFNIAPFGQDHSDYLVAQMTAALSNRWRGKGETATKATDWLPYHKQQPQTWQEQLAIVRSIKRGNSSKH